MVFGHHTNAVCGDVAVALKAVFGVVGAHVVLYREAVWQWYWHSPDVAGRVVLLAECLQSWLWGCSAPVGQSGGSPSLWLQPVSQILPVVCACLPLSTAANSVLRSHPHDRCGEQYGEMSILLPASL